MACSTLGRHIQISVRVSCSLPQWGAQPSCHSMCMCRHTLTDLQHEEVVVCLKVSVRGGSLDRLQHQLLRLLQGSTMQTQPAQHSEGCLLSPVSVPAGDKR